MKKIFIIFLFTLLLPVYTRADTNVSGTIDIDTTWSADGGVYILNGAVFITASTTLTIEPGVIIKGKNGGAGLLKISGKLEAHGTEEEPISFTSYFDDELGGDTDGLATSTAPARGDWQGIYVDSGGEVSLDYVNLRYAGYTGAGARSGIENAGGTVVISDSNISENNIRGVVNQFGTLEIERTVIENQSYGVQVNGGSVTVADSILRNNTNYGIDAYGAAVARLERNEFSGNGKTARIGAGTDFSHAGNKSADISNRGFEMSGTVASSTTWNSSDLPVIIPAGNALWVGASGSLDLSAGTVVKMGLGANFIVQGAMSAQGQDGQEVVFTSLADDVVSGDTNGNGASSTPQTGDWNGIEFQTGSVGNFSFVDIAYAGGFNGVSRAAIYNFGGAVEADDITFHDNFGNDIYQNAGAFNITDSQFSAGTSYAINNVSTSTLSAIHNWWGSKTGPTYSSNPNGAGRIVSDHVSFDPWIGRDPSLPNPVIIIPGIMGSYLKNSESNEEVWINLLKIVLPGSDSYLNDLSLNEDGMSNLPLVADGIIKKINVPLFSTDYFEGLLSVLESEGYVEDDSLFEYAYDWRLDIQTVADELREKIEEVKAITGAEKVDVVAHSMGGLLTKDFLKDNATSVGKFIDIGTPHVGSPKSLITLEEGETGIYLLNKGTIKFISQNMPSVYELLPSEAYFADGDYYVWDGVGKNERLSFEETKNYLKSSGRNQTLVDLADDFHRELDDVNPADYGVKTYNVVGCGTPTLGKFYLLDDSPTHPVYNIGLINGDGTVPAKSASAMLAEETYYVQSAVHATMPSMTGVKNLVADLLAGGDPSATSYANVSQDAANCRLPDGKIVSFHSPIELHVYNDNGDHAGPDESGDIENNIPGVDYEVIEDNKFAFLPSGAHYSIKGTATGEGSFSAWVEDFVDGEVATSTIFADLPLTAATRASFDIGDDAPDVIYLDNDGDDVYESTYGVSTTTAGSVDSLFLSPNPSSEDGDDDTENDNESNTSNENTESRDALGGGTHSGSGQSLHQVSSDTVTGAEELATAYGVEVAPPEVPPLTPAASNQAEETPLAPASLNKTKQEEGEKVSETQVAVAYKSLTYKLVSLLKQLWVWIKRLI